MSGDADFTVRDGYSGTSEDEVGIRVRYLNPDKTPVDLSGAEIEVKVAFPGGTTMVANLSGGGITYDAATGEIAFPIEILTFSAMENNTTATFAIVFEPSAGGRTPILTGQIKKVGGVYG